MALPESKARFTEADVAFVRGRYEARVARLGVTRETLHSGSVEAQHARFAVHASALPSSGASVLDIGCGLGDFYAYLQCDGFIGSYTGIDIVPAYVEQCRRVHPECVFEVANPAGEGISGDYDTVVLCQTLNTRLPAGNNLEVMGAALAEAFRHARHSVSFDMLSTYVDYREDDLFYYPPDEILALAKELTRWVVLRHDYRPYEFSVQLYRHPRIRP